MKDLDNTNLPPPISRGVSTKFAEPAEMVAALHNGYGIVSRYRRRSSNIIADARDRPYELEGWLTHVSSIVNRYYAQAKET